MESNVVSKWKEGIWDDNPSQVVRIFRVKEIMSLLDNIDIKDETGSGSRSWLRKEEYGLDTDDVRAWLRFLLYSGCRFSESITVHENPNLYRKTGSIRLPDLPGGKEKRTIKARNVWLSTYGREHIPEFYEAGKLPVSNLKEMNQTLISLTLIMHKAGNKIGLPEETFTKVSKDRMKDADGNDITYEKDVWNKKTHLTEKKTRYQMEKNTYTMTTNGCMVRSMRKTWESWLFSYFDGRKGPDLKDQIYLSQGHTQKTAFAHYINLADFDKEDMKDIENMIKGYGETD